MQKLIDYKGIEETIQFIESQHELLDKTKTQLENYLNYTKNGKFDLSEEGTVDERIKKIENVLDKYDEIVKRRTNITTSTETLKKNTEEVLNKTKDILEFSGKQEDIASKQNEFDAIYKELYSELRNCDTELASDLYAVKYKIDIKENQIEKIDGQIMQLKEDLYNGQNVNIVKNNTLAVYEEMLADLNKFDESQLSENKKNELKTKKEDLPIESRSSSCLYQ